MRQARTGQAEIRPRPGSLERILGDIATPALIVDLDLLKQNLREMGDLCAAAGVELYPHAKTHRTVEFGQLQLANGAQGLTVATLDEAEAFVDGGAQPLLIAYPLVDATKIRRAVALAERAEITFAADSVNGATAIGREFSALGRTAPLLLIVDSGMRRCGVRPSDVVPVAREVVDIVGVDFRGILTHEGSVYEATDTADVSARSRACADLMTQAAGALRGADIPTVTVSMGASSSARVVARVPGVTQVRPGRYAFNDVGLMSLQLATPGTCAARVAATVVSRPEPDRACIDAGSKSLGQDGVPPMGSERYGGFGFLVDLPGWRLYRLSEEHGWLRWTGSSSPSHLSIGQRVQVIPNHVCMAFFSLGESFAVAGGELVGQWPTISKGHGD